MRPIEAAELASRFDPFRDPYLADPYLFFAEARAASPVFYSPELNYWIVTRYVDVRHVFQTPKLFSAANALSLSAQHLVSGTARAARRMGHLKKGRALRATL